MSKEVKFKFFLNGIETKKEAIDWNRSCSARVKNGNEVHVQYLSYLLDKDKAANLTNETPCGHSLRYKACGVGYPPIGSNQIFQSHEDTDRVFKAMFDFHQSTPTEGVKEEDGKLNYELDWGFLTQMAERMSKNKDKYPPYNWKKPMDIEKLKQATFRHMLEIMNGNYEDDGRMLGHLEAVALNAMMINYQLKNKK